MGKNLRLSSYIRKPLLVTLHPIASEFPYYMTENFVFFFISAGISTDSTAAATTFTVPVTRVTSETLDTAVAISETITIGRALQQI